MTPNAKGHSVTNISEPIVLKPRKHPRQRAKSKPRKRENKPKVPKGSGFDTNKIAVADFLGSAPKLDTAGDVIDAIMASTPGPNIGNRENPTSKVDYPDPGKKVSRAKPSGFSQFAAEVAVANLPVRKKPPPFRGA